MNTEKYLAKFMMANKIERSKLSAGLISSYALKFRESLDAIALGKAKSIPFSEKVLEVVTDWIGEFCDADGIHDGDEMDTATVWRYVNAMQTELKKFAEARHMRSTTVKSIISYYHK